MSQGVNLKHQTSSIFKYRAMSKTSIELLVNQEIWFAKPDSLNDPFDCQLEYQRSLEVALSKFNASDDVKEQYKKAFKNYLENVGIFSCSRTRKNQLMWAHYSDEHRGFCIGFNEEKLKKDIPELTRLDVSYQASLPFEQLQNSLEVFDEEDFLLGNINEKIMLNTYAKTILRTKYTYWGYEKERRLISKKFGAQTFSPRCVNSIAFGLRMSERDKKTICTILRGSEWSHVKLYQASKSTDKFGLEFNEL